MKQIKKRMFFQIASLLLLFIFTFQSCKKDYVSIQQNVLISDSTLAKKLSTSFAFKSILINLENIETAIKSNAISIQENIDRFNLFKETASITNEEALNLFLLKLGYTNANDIVKYTVNNNSLLSDVLATFPEFYNLNKERVLLIFKLAYKINKSKSVKLIQPMMFSDECSINYGFGMEGCSEALGFDLIEAQLGLAFPTPFNLGITLTLTALAYYKEYNCKISVVQRWKACRTASPI